MDKKDIKKESSYGIAEEDFHGRLMMLIAAEELPEDIIKDTAKKYPHLSYGELVDFIMKEYDKERKEESATLSPRVNFTKISQEEVDPIQIINISKDDDIWTIEYIIQTVARTNKYKIKLSDEHFRELNTVDNIKEYFSEFFDNEENVVRFAIADYHNVSLSEILELDMVVVKGKPGLYEIFYNGIDYIIVTDESQAEEIAKEIVCDDLNDSPEIFNSNFLENHVKVNDAMQIAIDDAYSYFEGISDEQLIEDYDNGIYNEFDERIDEINDQIEEITSEEDISEELAQKISQLEEEISNIESKKEKYIENLREEKENEMANETERMLENNPIEYLRDNYGQTFKELLSNGILTINLEEASEAAVNEDGWRHWIGGDELDKVSTPKGYVIILEG